MESKGRTRRKGDDQKRREAGGKTEENTHQFP